MEIPRARHLRAHAHDTRYILTILYSRNAAYLESLLGGQYRHRIGPIPTCEGLLDHEASTKMQCLNCCPTADVRGLQFALFNRLGAQDLRGYILLMYYNHTYPKRCATERLHHLIESSQKNFVSAVFEPAWRRL